MQKKLIATSVVALFLLAMIPIAHAFSGFGGKGFRNPQNANIDHSAVQAAFENGDYQAFIAATGKTQLTEEKFNTIIAKKAEKKSQHKAIEAAIDAGDYATWKSLIEAQNPNHPLLSVIDAGNFSKLQELHNLREQMQTIHEELGMGPGYMGKGFGKEFGDHGKAKGMGRGTWR
ncbi:MAG: hypothetical protein ABIH35_01930 [Patescibacteria group bacterium]